MTHELFYLSRDQILMTHELFYFSRDRILMTREVLYLSCDQTLMTREQTLITQHAFYLVHELTNLSERPRAFSGHKEAPSGFAYFCPRNRKGVSADANKPKSVVRKPRNEVIDRCSDIRPN